MPSVRIGFMHENLCFTECRKTAMGIILAPVQMNIGSSTGASGNVLQPSVKFWTYVASTVYSVLGWCACSRHSVWIVHSLLTLLIKNHQHRTYRPEATKCKPALMTQKYFNCTSGRFEIKGT